DLRRDEGWVSIGIDHDTAPSRSMRFAGGGGRGPRRLSSGAIAGDYGGGWRQQRAAHPPLEGGTAATRESDRTGDHRVSLPTGDEQVEQDRTSPLLAHRDELAWHAARQSRRHRQPDCLDAQSVGAPRPIGDRSTALPRWHDRYRCADGHRPPHATRVSWPIGITRFTRLRGVGVNELFPGET